MTGSWSIVNLNWSWRTFSCCLLTLTQPYGLILAPNLLSCISTFSHSSRTTHRLSHLQETTVCTMNVPIAANLLGTIGAICWSVQVRNSVISPTMMKLTPLSTAHTPNHHQLSPPSYYRLTAFDDAPVGFSWCTVRRVQHCRTVQHCTKNTGPDTNIFESVDVEPMLPLRKRMEYRKMCPNSSRDVHSDG